MGVSFEAQTPAAHPETHTRVPRSYRPNYTKLHSQPLPVKAYPLPPLIPHNPLSLLHIAYIYLSQLVAPPSSHPQNPLCGYLSAETRSVHISDEATARILWEQGFFGKGSLSRSEPAWLEREKIRQGLLLGNTSEEATRQRREERAQFKKERARKEREAIDEKLAEEAITGTNEPDHNTAALEGTVAGVSNPVLKRFSSDSPLLPNENGIPKPTPSSHADIDGLNHPDSVLQSPSKGIANQEHLQLTLEEAFFLVYGLGVLNIRDSSTSQTISTPTLFSICRSQSYFPAQSSAHCSPDDAFLLSYVVYHHFRSLGWVVRPGIKFAVDYLLYNRGPVFSHAEFAVIILPSFSHAYWSSTPGLRAMVRKREEKSWWWLHCVNRVQAHVRKSLMLVYVEVPPPAEVEQATNQAGEVLDVGRFLSKYHVRELMLKRWTPNRSRD
ncbi:MAG: hypothetical protein LQ346_003100 [Caloplaca aetnensis]|nr:MAG: hypothetical protein LQ346_003100 [Caloplaca aetnensis]